jgi:hypothetical protein
MDVSGTFYGNQIMRTREAAHRVLIEPSLGDPCTALCVIDRVPKPRAALAAASLSALGLSRRKITHTSTSIWVMPVRSSAPKKLEPPHPLFPSCVTRPRPKAGRAANDEAYRCGPVHSACAPIPAALMIGHHFSISAFWNVASPSGVCSGSRGATSSPRSANRLRTAGSASASTIAPLSLAMMSFGVPLGAKNPNHPDIESPGSPLPSEAGTESPYEFSSAPARFRCKRSFTTKVSPTSLRCGKGPAFLRNGNSDEACYAKVGIDYSRTGRDIGNRIATPTSPYSPFRDTSHDRRTIPGYSIYQRAHKPQRIEIAGEFLSPCMPL